jgi:hypothetical protein
MSTIELLGTEVIPQLEDSGIDVTTRVSAT